MEWIPIGGVIKTVMRLFQVRPNDIRVCQTSTVST